jgi:hypothetical protein
MKENYPDKCSWCGKFISEKDYENGAYIKYTPDTEYSFEDYEVCCIKCNLSD